MPGDYRRPLARGDVFRPRPLNDNATKFLDMWKEQGHPCRQPVPHHLIMMEDTSRTPMHEFLFEKIDNDENVKREIYGCFCLAWGGLRGGGFWVAL